jgi:hypothetical protein
VSGVICQALARRLTQETRVYNVDDDVAGSVCRAPPHHPPRLAGAELVPALVAVYGDGDAAPAGQCRAPVSSLCGCGW